MKSLKFLGSFCFAMAFVLFACKDEALNPVPAWEYGLHGFGVTTKNLSATDVNAAAEFTHYWQSLDGKLTATDIKMYVYWDESYVDASKNTRTARHAGFVFDEPGRLLKTATVKANREVTTYTVTQAELSNLFKDIKPINARTADKPFTKDDKFTIRWVIVASDGRVFDRWGESICVGEVAGANCTTAITVK